jgi:two-component system NtrC family sensor kinase
MKSMKSTVKRTDEEEVLKILSDQAPVGVCIMQDGKFCYVNSNFPIATGYTADELVGKDPLELIVPEDREMVRENEIKMLKGELLSPYQFRVIHKDGSIRWVMEVVKSVQYHGRRAVLGNYMEVTERKQMEETLKESEERYRELANSITDVFFAMDEHLRYTYWNKASEILTGIRAEDAIGKSIREIFPDTPGTRNAEKVYREVLRTEQPQTFVNDYDIDGRRYIFEISAYPSRGGISVFVRDIHERKQAEEALRQSEERYRTILEEMEDSYFEVDLGGHLTFVNNSMCRDLGYSVEELIGRRMSYKGFTIEEDIESVFRVFNEVYRTGVPNKGFPWKIIRKDGTQGFTETSVSPLRNDNGEIIGFRGTGRDITERKKMEEALRQSEERYRTILEETGDGYFETGLAGNFTFVNDVQARLLGYSREEMSGMNFRTFTPEEKVKVVFEAYNRIYKTGEPLRDFVDEVIRKDGSHGFAETSAFPIRNDKGEIIGFRGVRRDITERKKMEEALKQSEEKYRTILEEMEDSYFEVDLGGHFIFANSSTCRNLGYSRKELFGMSYKNFTAEDDIESVFRVFNEVYQTGVPNKGFPWKIIRKDGTRGFAEASVSPLRNDNGEIIGFRGVGRDVTERQKMEEALRQNEENYRALFDSSVIGMLVLDAETMKVVMANKAAAKIFGFSSVEEGIGANPLDFVPLEDREGVLEVIVKELFEQDLRQPHELQAITKDGRKIWVSITGARIMHEGRLAGLISFTDITEQKQQNERLMLTDRLASLGELASGAAHELNNPLTSIIGFSQLLMEKEVPDDIREDLTLIYSEAQRAASVTKNLLTFARKHAPVKQRDQINNIIEDVLKLRTYEHKVSGIEVEGQFDPDLPKIMVDYFQMQQVFMNIIINAEYFMTKAHNKGTLTITTKKQSNTVLISIADDGPGIPPENLKRIFDPFFTTKEAGKGTGLGLSICHGIVTEHGGQIYARSQLGKGATIFVELPINSRDHIGGMFKTG